MTPAQQAYRDYLETPYWKTVSETVKKHADYRCQVCNSPHNLLAHHRTYQYRGREMDHLGEMTCMCTRCHNTFHGATETRTGSTDKVVRSSYKAPGMAKAKICSEPVTLTSALIEQCLTNRGGITSATLVALGEPAQNNSGWRKRLIGKTVSGAAFQQALEGRNKRA